jgi:hypothetical protein
MPSLTRRSERRDVSREERPPRLPLSQQVQETYLDERAAAQEVRLPRVPPAAPLAGPASLAIEEIYRRLRPSLVARCYQILQSPHAAQDASQDVFLRTMKQGTRFQSEDDARRYMLRVARNVSLNILRANRHLTSLPEVVVEAQELTLRRLAWSVSL